MKHLPSILATIVLSLGVVVLVAHAQNYVPLAPLPLGDNGTTPASYNLTSYLSGILKLLIALGGALAILMAIIGGTQYVAAGIQPSAKEDAKHRIENAFIGLALILSSYLILNSINPKLVAFNLMLEKVTPKALETFTSDTWGDDSAVRSVLANDTTITVNKTNCATVGQQECTSVFGLNGNAISGLRALDAQTCSVKNVIGLRRNSCSITITGGTEYWLHRSHNDGRKVDLSQGGDDGTLKSYITKGGTLSITDCGVATDPHYQPDGSGGGTYVDEPNRASNGEVTGTGQHWHVCY